MGVEEEDSCVSFDVEVEEVREDEEGSTWAAMTVKVDEVEEVEEFS